MKYLFYLLFIAAIFGLVALGDWLLGKLCKKRPTGKVVRMPRYSLILGLLIGLLGLMGVLYVPRSEERFLWFGCWIVLVMGAYLLVNFFWSGIFYDSEGFTYRPFPKKGKTYRYADINGQRTFVTKSGWNANLYANGEEIQLFAAMQGVSDFLNYAFFAWCRQTGIDPDTVENDPHNLIFFPDPDKQA